MNKYQIGQKNKNFYKNQFLTFGPNDSQSIAWSSKETQLVRFKVLSQVADLKGKSIIDIGCGYGDFFDYLKDREIDYTGIEITPELIREGRKKYSDINLIEGNFLDYSFKRDYDYVLASGALSMKIEDYSDYLKMSIERIWSLVKEGLAFNLPSSLSLTSKLSKPFPGGVEPYYSDPTEVFKLCKSYTPWVVLRHDYLDHDFTIYMYRKSLGG